MKHRAPPPVLHELGTRSFSGVGILEEYRGDIAFVLWVSFRDVELWAKARPSTDTLLNSVDRTARVRLIETSTATIEFQDLKQPLLRVAEVLEPVMHEPRSIASGCATIAGFSELRSCLRTAVEYAQVASLTVPTEAQFAVHAARLLRMRAEYERASVWFDYSVYLARITENWDAYARAYSGLGCLHMQRGNIPMARRVLRRSLRAARRHDLAERKASAYHNLFAVEAISENWELAERYAERALLLYPPGSRGRVRLARDLAFRWIERGVFDTALALSKAVIDQFEAPADRALVWSDIARAAAACGDLAAFEDAWANAWVPVHEGRVEPFEGDILLNLAHAAATRFDATRTRLAAERAVEVGRRRKEGQVVLQAEAVLGSLRDTKPPESPAPVDPTRRTTRLMRRFVRELTS
jgi:hypothetical protein